jgi:hypothetical protein
VFGFKLRKNVTMNMEITIMKNSVTLHEHRSIQTEKQTRHPEGQKSKEKCRVMHILQHG